VRQVEAIHPPKGMVSLMVWEIVVGRFKYPEICLIFLGHPTILAKQDSVLILNQKPSAVSGLAAQLGDDSAYLGIHVRKRIEQFAQPFQIISIPTQMSVNEDRLGVPSENIVLLRNDGFPFHLVI